MLSAYLFDQRQGESVASWADTLGHLEGSQVLWVDLLDISDAEDLGQRCAWARGSRDLRRRARDSCTHSTRGLSRGDRGLRR
jgi:hypothetical protein